MALLSRIPCLRQKRPSSAVQAISAPFIHLIDTCRSLAILNTIAVAAVVTASDTPSAAGVSNFMTTITLDNNIQSDLEKASKLIGVDERELATRAILHYLHNIREEMNLADEFAAWEQVSDEALINMERELASDA
jgi:hypothetical protein